MSSDSPISYADLERSPAYQLWLATNAWQRMIRRALEPLDLTHAQFIAIASIDRLAACKMVTQVQIAKFCGFDENMTSQLVKSLEAKGLIARSKHPTDARAHSLALTAKGRELVEQARAIIKPMSESFFEPIGEEKWLLAELLRKVHQAADICRDADV